MIRRLIILLLIVGCVFGGIGIGLHKSTPEANSYLPISSQSISPLYSLIISIPSIASSRINFVDYISLEPTIEYKTPKYHSEYSTTILVCASYLKRTIKNLYISGGLSYGLRILPYSKPKFINQFNFGLRYQLISNLNLGFELVSETHSDIEQISYKLVIRYMKISNP